MRAAFVLYLLLAGPLSAEAADWSVGQATVSPEYVLCKNEADCLSRTVKIVDMDLRSTARPQIPAAPVAPVSPAFKEISVRFGLASSVLTDKARGQIRKLVLEARASPTFTVTGMTDKLGSTRFNRRLAHARALSVQRFLINTGVQAERIVVDSSCCVEFPPVANPPARRAVIRLSDTEKNQ